MPTISFAAAAGCALTALEVKETIVSSAANVKTVLRWYVPAARDVQTAQLSAPNAEKNVKPAPMISFATAAVYAGIV